MEEYDLFQVLDAVASRWRQIFPDWEIFSVSAPMYNKEERKRIMEFVFRLMDEEAENKPTHISGEIILQND